MVSFRADQTVVEALRRRFPLLPEKAGN